MKFVAVIGPDTNELMKLLGRPVNVNEPIIYSTESEIVFVPVPKAPADRAEIFLQALHEMMSDTPSIGHKLNAVLGFDSDHGFPEDFAPLYAAVRKISPEIRTIDAVNAGPTQSADIDTVVNGNCFSNETNLVSAIVAAIGPTSNTAPSSRELTETHNAMRMILNLAHMTADIPPRPCQTSAGGYAGQSEFEPTRKDRGLSLSLANFIS